MKPGTSFQNRVNKVIKCLEDDICNNKIKDYSCQCSYEWGPKNLIPKGYVWVKEGKVEDGDFVWVSEHCNEYDFWRKVDNNSSLYAKVGQTIEKKGIRFIHEDKSETLFEYYKPFIVRKNERQNHPCKRL